MTRRTPARLLAPLALVAVAVALIAVVGGASPGGGGSTGEPASTEQAAPATGETRTTRDRGKPRGRSTYTIKPGDTPSGIAEETGVPVERLLELNPDVDAQSLQAGARLKLR